MTIPVSTVPAVKAYLYANLPASLTADGNLRLAVVYSKPGTNQPPDIVAVGKATRGVEFLAFVGDGGPGARQERYNVTLTVSVFRAGGTTGQTATERWYALVGQIEQFVRGDLTLGGLVSSAWPVASDEDTDWSEDGKGWLCEGTVDIQCLAEL